MKLGLSAVLALALMVSAVVAVGRSSGTEPARVAPTAWPTDGRPFPKAVIITAAERILERAPSPARTGTGLRFENGRCAVEWTHNPYGPWLYELACEPEPASPEPLSAPAPLDRPWVGIWPEALWAAVEVIDWCESKAGTHRDTYRLDTLHGGRMQIAQTYEDGRPLWRAYFEREYGWTWEQVVRDDRINSQAAYVIYQRSGTFQPWPFCGRAYR